MGAGDPDRREATLGWLVRAHPEARVSAVGLDSQPVEVPPALGFPPPPPAEPGEPRGLEAIVPDDRIAVIRAYERARSAGTAAVAVRLVDGEHVHLHLLDLRGEHGCILFAGVPDDGSVALPTEDAELLAPRVTWARLDGQGIVLDAGPASVEMFGWPIADVLGEPALPFIHPDDHGRALKNWISVLAAPGERRRYRARHLRRDGSHVWLDITNHNRLVDPEHGDVLSEMVDVSDEMSVHDALRDREQLLRELTDALPVGVVQFGPDGAAVHENEQFLAIVGATGLAGLLDAVVDDDDRTSLRAALDEVFAGRLPRPVEAHLARDRVCRVTLRPLIGSGGLVCVDDVTEAVRLRRELEVRATFDDLTACFSRSAILGALEDAADEGPGTGAIFVDLDRFKPVNDELGHAAGDELLAEIGDRLRRAVRDIDLVGRLGGDEFLVVCPGLADAADVETIARRVMARLAEPMALRDEHLVRPRASIGVAWAPAGTDPAALVARADAAMYESKRQSRVDPNSPTKLTISPG